MQSTVLFCCKNEQTTGNKTDTDNSSLISLHVITDNLKYVIPSATWHRQWKSWGSNGITKPQCRS